jgi:hypothetical protein
MALQLALLRHLAMPPARPLPIRFCFFAIVVTISTLLSCVSGCFPTAPLLSSYGERYVAHDKDYGGIAGLL